jgi:DNA-directed RNA polymerase subunit RPC12/RpoP
MNDLVILQTFDNFFNANLQLTRLRAAGVECYLKDEYIVTIDPFLSNAVGGIKLMVRKTEEHRIRKLLREMNASADKQLLCPQCGSHKFILVPKRSTENMLAAITTWLFSAYAVSAENVYQCSDCGYESEALPETEPESYN